MNWAERRRLERAEMKRRSTLRVPEGQLVRAEVLTPTGEVAEVTNWRKLPAKQPGVHRWMCTVAHYFTPEQAEAFASRSPGSPVLLDASSVMFAGLGCFDCEEAYEPAKGSPCPAGDEWTES